MVYPKVAPKSADKRDKLLLPCRPVWAKMKPESASGKGAKADTWACGGKGELV